MTLGNIFACPRVEIYYFTLVKYTMKILFHFTIQVRVNFRGRSKFLTDSRCPTNIDFDFVFNTSDHKAAKVNNQFLVHLPSGSYEIGLTGKSSLKIEISYKDSGKLY